MLMLPIGQVFIEQTPGACGQNKYFYRKFVAEASGCFLFS